MHCIALKLNYYVFALTVPVYNNIFVRCTKKKVKNVLTEKLLDKLARVHINHKIELLSLNALNGSINLSIICFFLRRTTVTRIGLGTAVRT